MPDNIVVGDYLIDSIDDIGKGVVQIALRNESESIKGVIRDNCDLFLNTYKQGDSITCRAKKVSADTYEISAVTRANVAIIGFNIDDWKKRFIHVWQSVENPEYRAILDAFFVDPDIMDEFFVYPAAKGNHHAHKHGLLKHTVEVAEISDSLFKYSRVGDRDLLITGALLHDVGKMREYDIDEGGVISRSNIGKLVGHLPLSALFVSKIVPENIDANKMMLLYHLIFSHHGKKEYGSPVEPMTIEAMILHLADLSSCNIDGIGRLKEKEKGNGWSSNENMFKKEFLL